MLELEFWTRRIAWLGVAALAISAITWTLDLTGIVYVCPYCRTQRTVIGLLGLLMLTPQPGHWIARYVGTVFAALGVVVGATQHFNGWRKIMKGEYTLSPRIFDDAFLLSGAALFIMIGQILLIYAWRRQAADAPNPPAG